VQASSTPPADKTSRNRGIRPERDQWFESVFLQRRVNDLSVPLDEGVFEPPDLLQTRMNGGDQIVVEAGSDPPEAASHIAPQSPSDRSKAIISPTPGAGFVAGSTADRDRAAAHWRSVESLRPLLGLEKASPFSLPDQ
jgi:hypothetical protein